MTKQIERFAIDPTTGRRHIHMGTKAEWLDYLSKRGLKEGDAVKTLPPTDLTKIPLSRRALRKWLLQLDVKDSNVRAAINQEPDETKREENLIDWEDAREYHFDHPLVEVLMASLGLDSAIAAAKWGQMVSSDNG